MSKDSGRNYLHLSTNKYTNVLRCVYMHVHVYTHICIYLCTMYMHIFCHKLPPACLVTTVARYISLDSCQRETDPCPHQGFVGWFCPSICSEAFLSVHYRTSTLCTFAQTFQTAVCRNGNIHIMPSSSFYKLEGLRIRRSS